MARQELASARFYESMGGAGPRATPTWQDGPLYSLGAMGDLTCFAAVTPERLEERARFRASKGKTWNHPALADGRLPVRNAVEMACFDVEAE